MESDIAVTQHDSGLDVLHVRFTLVFTETKETFALTNHVLLGDSL